MNNKVEEIFKVVRTNLNTIQIDQLIPLLKAEVNVSKKVNLNDVRINNISEAGYPIVNGRVIDEFDLADLENKERDWIWKYQKKSFRHMKM